MIPLMTASEMNSLERKAIDGWGMPSLVLQEHAALGALGMVPGGEPLQVLAGPGNNGGDALALARLARLQGRQVQVWTLDPQPGWKGDAGLQARLWEGLGGTYRHAPVPAEAVAGFRGWVVDGLFGLGTRLPLRGPAEAWVQALAAAAGPGAPFRILALDLPSGLDPSSPEVDGPAVRADRTACFGLFKVCHGLRPARDLCGEITLVPIPLAKAPAPRLRLLSAPEPQARRWDAHKKDFGHLAIRAGSQGMSGAAVMAALGALRMGCGLVTVLTDPQVRAEVAAQVPEAMVRPWDGQVPPGIDALVAGPGGITEVPGWDGPLVLDASALEAGAGARWLARPETVITPHPGEFARLFPGAQPRTTSERLARAAEVATGPGILVLKGAQSIVAGGGDPELWVNPTGHPGLSAGGAGDFLAGMVGARVAQWRRGAGPGPLKGAVGEAVWLHGAAADRLGPGPLMIRELGASLAALLREAQDAAGRR
ncbi:MAG: NAD(P)H-hydrate dehydratase [Holophaga sp.]|jgi:NAD(P)H-hydrate epimerase